MAPHIQRELSTPTEVVSGSDYKKRFFNGATIFPRVLFIVEKKVAGPLGQREGMIGVHSSRSANEKKPWKDLTSLDGVVETEFVRPIYLGESVLPYRASKPAFAVIPRDGKGLLEPQGERIDHFPGLAAWAREAEQRWIANRSSEGLSFLGQMNYHGKLENQFPMEKQRVLYTASGMHVAAARVENRRAIVEHKLYWATAASKEEAHYLCAILNAAVITQMVRPLMSYGKDERDIDKHIWKLPIPMFDEENPEHAELAKLGQQAEEAIAKLKLDTDKHFAASRRVIREFLADSDVGKEIERRVTELVGDGDGGADDEG